MNEVLLILAGAAPTAVFSLIDKFLTKKKYHEEIRQAKATAQGSELDNVEKAAKIWRELSEQMKVNFDSQYQELKLENQEMKSKFDTVLKENTEMRKQMASLEKELKATKAENIKLTEALKLFNKNFKSDERGSKLNNLSKASV